ncbi:MAG: penicillin-binding protein, partial [Actinobacteria bacterium]|nr:penicillin-binding protein [Actinomycetota bacterium]
GIPPGIPPGGPPGTPPGTSAPGPVPGLPPLSSRYPGAPTGGGKRRLLWAGIAVAVLVVVGGGIAAYALLHTRGSPQQTAQDYLSAWQENRVSDMQRVSVGVPPGGLAQPVHQAEADLGVRSKTIKLGTVQPGSGGTADAAYTAALTLGNGIHWTYQGSLHLVRQKQHWWVSWSDAAIYPQLRAGQRFQVTAQWLPRAGIFAADGTRLDSAQAQQESGSVQMITGSVGPLTAAQAKQLGAPYKAGDMAGQGGIEQADERRLAGTPRTVIQLVDSHGNVQHQLASFAGKAGTPVKTSINMTVQQAASHAVASANVGSKPVAMVAIRPSTGEVLAVIDRPGGFDRALQGTYPPGSTFKMITASALAEQGMRPSNPVPCPATIKIGGRTFHNYDYEKLGTTNLLTAFAVSCNTTFAQLGSQQLTGGKLAAMAQQFGFNTTPALGIPAALGHFTAPTDSTDLAADAFGQGEDIVNPLQLATVAGALGNGTWRSPRLVLDPAPAHIPPSHQLDPTVTSVLRPMMAAVVSQGTAAHVGFPPGVYGKTGTAEYGNGPNPPSHAWFAGYRGDLAFAVIVEGGGVGADSSGPIANAFLRGQ